VSVAARHFAPAERRLSVAVARRWWVLACAVAAGAWVVVALAGSSRVPALPAAAAAGTAVLAAAPALAVPAAPDVTALLALLVVPLAVAEAARGGNAAPLGLAMCGVVALAAMGRGPHQRSALAVLPLGIGTAAVVAGIVAGSSNAARLRLTVTDRPAAALVLAGAAVLIGAVDGRLGAERAVAAPALLAALLAVPPLPPLAMAAGWGAYAVAAAFLERPAVATAAMAVVAAAAGAPAAALLLGAAAVLAWSVDAPLSVVCALPGAVALANVLAGHHVTAVAATTGVALGGTALAALVRFRPTLRVDGGRPIALALGGWLVLAPGTWTFTGGGSLRAYDTGAARAVAAAAITMFAVVFRRGAEWEWPEPAAGGPDDPVTIAPGAAAALRAAAVAAAGIAVAWLVVSVIRSH
jgi:hypothetical protein